MCAHFKVRDFYMIFYSDSDVVHYTLCIDSIHLFYYFIMCTGHVLSQEIPLD